MKRWHAFLCTLALLLLTTAVYAAPAVQESKTSTDTIRISYPRFGAIADANIVKEINRAVAQKAQAFLESCKADQYCQEAIFRFKTHYISKDRLSFETLTYVYSGGAHGITQVEGWNYDLKTGEKGALTRWFDYRPSDINRSVFAHAHAQNVFLFGDFKGITAYPQNFYLNAQGKPVVLFQQYEIAPYSSGVIRVELD